VKESPSSIQWAEPVAPDRVRVGRLDGQVVVEWPGIGQLMASPSGSDERWTPSPSLSPELLEKFRSTELLACRRYLAGLFSLHGSAVQFASGAVAFVGPSEAGKSSAAMALVERLGASFMADDVVPVDWQGPGAVVTPVNDSLWLLDDVRRRFGRESTQTGKLACSPRTRATNEAPLRAIVDLAFGLIDAKPRLLPLHGSEAFLVLSHAHVCYRSGDPGEDTRNFEQRARLSRAVPVFRFERPRSLDLLDEMAYAVKGLVETLLPDG
jgi:hypothetical protein